VGDVPEGSYARLMRANFDRLVEGAHGAAEICTSTLAPGKTQLALLISCVGRKIVLNQRIEEEVEAVREVLGDQTILAGFYSYGEVCPFAASTRCELHNQTMTITTFSED
ncbi:MAG: FIST C-terminal domain-containing protein, partial [Bdellovibrionales bacterium]|nr:FIST C-terminal domain-containing protein [Bdellovibrionales bacterium]